jgi:HK97 family phage major capsid protein
MEQKELNDILNKQFEEIKGLYTEKVKAMADGKADITEVKALGTKLDETLAGMQKQLDGIDKNLGDQMKAGESKTITWAEAVHKAVKENADQFIQLADRKINSLGFQIESKTVGVMQINTNLSGSSGVPTYAPGIVAVPNTPRHLTELIATVPSATDLYHYIRHDETIGEGSFDWHAPNANIAKPQRDYDFTDVTVTLQDLAAYTKITRNMLRNIPALESYLSQYLPEDYYNAEDSKGYAALVAAAATVGSTAGGYNGLLETIGILGDVKYGVNGIVMRPSVIYSLMATQDTVSGYTVPGAVMVDNFGILRINGVPVYAATWVAADTAVLGDWRYFKKIQSQGLNVRSTEFDQDDFVKNRVTFRTEATIGFAIERPAAFSVIDMGFSG